MTSRWVRFPEIRAALTSGDVWYCLAKSGGVGTWFGPGFDGDLPHPSRDPAQSAMSRIPSQAVTFSDPGAARARSMPRAVTASRHTLALVLGCTLCITVPSAQVKVIGRDRGPGCRATRPDETGMHGMQKVRGSNPLSSTIFRMPIRGKSAKLLALD